MGKNERILGLGIILIFISILPYPDISAYIFHILPLLIGVGLIFGEIAFPEKLEKIPI